MGRKSLVVGNWKMFGNQEMLLSCFKGLSIDLGAVNGCEVAVCPPTIYLKQCGDMLEESQISIGAQDLCGYAVDKGAYTGEVSAHMLEDMACTFVILGHSERREYQKESDELVAQKFNLAQQANLTPILCVGESLEQREAGDTLDFVGRQLDAVLKANGIDAFESACIAYEPIWAIGTGLSATPEQAQEVHAFIRHKLSESNPKTAEKVQILYGGSVKPGNAAALFAEPDIDGALVGGASLTAEDFAAICQLAEV